MPDNPIGHFFFVIMEEFLALFREKKRILIAPLDWGLGHATRMYALAQILENHGHTVFFASSGLAYTWLNEKYPKTQIFKISSYNVKFSGFWGITFSLLISYFKFKKTIQKENEEMTTIVTQNQIDTIISDHRYGVYHSNTFNIFVCHQLHLLVPKYLRIFSFIANKIHHKLIEKFQLCIVPDFQDHRLAGKLSKVNHFPIPKLYIGALSRFQFYPNNLQKDLEVPDVFAWISGPEPHRKNLELKLIEKLKKIKGKHLICTGIIENEPQKIITQNSEINILPNISDHLFFEYIKNSKILICRSGYTSIMDLYVCNRKAILLPTTGQTEQEYLAEYHKNNHTIVKEKDFDGFEIEW